MISLVEFVAERSETRVAPAFARLVTRWHLLSLDAPFVAAVWTWFVARACGVHLGWTVLVAMFFAVWVLYAADRLLDTRSGLGDGHEERHYFHHRHRRAFRWGIVLACLALATLLPGLSWAEVRLYLAIGALLLGWFVVIHSGARPLPKEFVVGIFFAAAVFVPAAVGTSRFAAQLLTPAALFGALCSLNCVFIHAWEHEDRAAPETHRLTSVASQNVVLCACLLTSAAFGLSLILRIPELPLAVAFSSALLVALHRARSRFEPRTLRALADLVLLTPLLVEGFRR